MRYWCISAVVIELHIVISLDAVQNQEKETYCRERNRLINGDKSDIYHLAEALVGENIALMCHYWYVYYYLLTFAIVII